MNPPDIREVYFNWLHDQVEYPKNASLPDRQRFVCMHLHVIQFNDAVPNDDNRTAEGEELRDEFLSQLPVVDMEDYAKIYELGKASVLEVLTGLARRAEYTTGLSARAWMQIFLMNLGLDRFDDLRFKEPQGLQIDEIIRVFNERRYDENGHGGIFPLKEAAGDQRRTELWDQMSEFMRQNNMF